MLTILGEAAVSEAQGRWASGLSTWCLELVVGNAQGCGERRRRVGGAYVRYLRRLSGFLWQHLHLTWERYTIAHETDSHVGNMPLTVQ